MTIADDINTVLANQASIAQAVHAGFDKLGNLPAGQAVDLTEELELLQGIKTDLEPTPQPATGGDPTANALNTAAGNTTTDSPSA